MTDSTVQYACVNEWVFYIAQMRKKGRSNIIIEEGGGRRSSKRKEEEEEKLRRCNCTTASSEKVNQATE